MNLESQTTRARYYNELFGKNLDLCTEAADSWYSTQRSVLGWVMELVDCESNGQDGEINKKLYTYMYVVHWRRHRRY
jgi:pyruvoyl-dependent arginine decarboxylase (PvlArgDC)